MLACQHDNMKSRGHLMDNGVRFGTFQSNSHQTSLSSLCPSVKCCWVASSPTALLAEGSRTAGAQPVCPLQVGPRERELTSHPSLGSLKSLAAPPPTSSSLPPSAWCSRHTDHTHQALIYSIYTILPSPLWLWGIWGMPLPLPAAHGASSILLNVSQSVAVGGVPSHRALLAVGSLPCGGSDHSTVLTTRDLAPQPTVIEVTSQAIPWWIIKRPETELKVT